MPTFGSSARHGKGPCADSGPISHANSGHVLFVGYIVIPDSGAGGSPCCPRWVVGLGSILSYFEVGGSDPAPEAVAPLLEQRKRFVAKEPKQPEQEGETPPQAAAPEAPAAELQQQQQRIQVQIEDSKALASYANFCRVTGTPEELIIDFGLNPQPIGIPTQPIVIVQRIITNFYTAKRMLHTLTLTVQRHEATFGVLETDVQKRVRPGLMGGPPR